MGWTNSRSCRKTHVRRMARYSEIGRKFEQEEMRRILQKMVEKGMLTEFEIYPPNSQEDKGGKDLRVSKWIGAAKMDRYCGVTISIKSWHEARFKHQDIPQFCFPIGTKPETIERRILELFKDP